MGIPRLTQGLQPHLENVVLSANPRTSSDLAIRNIVIDGPSMVYHIYNRILSYRLARTDVYNVCDVPTYSLLNLATQQFLHDIEACKIKITAIFFDGALPMSKRTVRLDRLEKSRRALELHRTAYPNLILSQQSFTGISDGELSQISWNDESGNPLRSSGIIAPFIVPSVLGYLRSSKWKASVFVVPGEADSFCARAVQDESAAIFTNDSDLVLYEGVSTVVLLNSLALSDSSTKSVNIQGRCWRPKQIAQQLGLRSLSYLAFARDKDTTASFNAVLQTAKDLQQGDDAADFLAFKADYAVSPNLPNQPNKLNDLDPRLAEVVCQLSDPAPAKKLHMTLPILLEDTNRDASWSYGKNIRRLAYSILIKSLSSLSTVEVLELSRKGPQIATNTFSLFQQAECEHSMESLCYQIDENCLSGSTGTRNVCSWVICALAMVWRERTDVGKSLFPAHVLAIVLGLAPWPTETQQGGTVIWDVMHLTANMQAVLYSIRLLKQSLRFGTPSLLSTLKANPTLIQTLNQMPAIDKIFLTPAEARDMFKELPRQELTKLLRRFATEFDLINILGLHTPRTKLNGPAEQAAPEQLNTDEFIVAGTKRKRAKRQHESPSVPSVRSQNLFDILSSAK